MRSPTMGSGHTPTASPLSSPRLAGQFEPSAARPTPVRRPTFASAIPIGHSAHAQSPTVSEDKRRRPSFKIDLPPRPAPTELLASSPATGPGPAGHTPYAVEIDLSEAEGATASATQQHDTKVTPHAERGAGRRLSSGALDMTHMRAEIDSIAYQAHAQVDAPARRPSMLAPSTSFRNPFEATPMREEAEHVSIRRPSGEGSGVRIDAPLGIEEDALATDAGLGYSLNRMRAPTPWARRTEDEGDWLTSEDVSRLHV